MFVSILRVFISTYSGFNLDGNAIFYDGEMQKRNGMNSVIHGRLLVVSYLPNRLSNLEKLIL